MLLLILGTILLPSAHAQIASNLRIVKVVSTGSENELNLFSLCEENVLTFSEVTLTLENIGSGDISVNEPMIGVILQVIDRSSGDVLGSSNFSFDDPLFAILEGEQLDFLFTGVPSNFPLGNLEFRYTILGESASESEPFSIFRNFFDSNNLNDAFDFFQANPFYENFATINDALFDLTSENWHFLGNHGDISITNNGHLGTQALSVTLPAETGRAFIVLPNGFFDGTTGMDLIFKASVVNAIDQSVANSPDDFNLVAARLPICSVNEFEFFQTEVNTEIHPLQQLSSPDEFNQNFSFYIFDDLSILGEQDVFRIEIENFSPNDLTFTFDDIALVPKNEPLLKPAAPFGTTGFETARATLPVIQESLLTAFNDLASPVYLEAKYLVGGEVIEELYELSDFLDFEPLGFFGRQPQFSSFETPAYFFEDFYAEFTVLANSNSFAGSGSPLFLEEHRLVGNFNGLGSNVSTYDFIGTINEGKYPPLSNITVHMPSLSNGFLESENDGFSFGTNPSLLTDINEPFVRLRTGLDFPLQHRLKTSAINGTQQDNVNIKFTIREANGPNSLGPDDFLPTDNIEIFLNTGSDLYTASILDLSETPPSADDIYDINFNIDNVLSQTEGFFPGDGNYHIEIRVNSSGSEFDVYILDIAFEDGCEPILIDENDITVEGTFFPGETLTFSFPPIDEPGITYIIDAIYLEENAEGELVLGDLLLSDEGEPIFFESETPQFSIVLPSSLDSFTFPIGIAIGVEIEGCSIISDPGFGGGQGEPGFGEPIIFDPTVENFPATFIIFNGFDIEEPNQPGEIEGPTALFQGDEGITFRVPEQDFVDDFIWEVSDGIELVTPPDGSDSITVNIAVDAVFPLEVSVRAENIFGPSEARTFTINSICFEDREITREIEGPTVLPIGARDVVFRIDPIEDAEEYVWRIEDSGSLFLEELLPNNAIEIDIPTSFVFPLTLTVTPTNRCDEGPTFSLVIEEEEEEDLEDPLFSMSGTVTQEGEPAGNDMNIRLFEQRGNVFRLSRESLTNEDGTFLIEDLPVGNYYLLAEDTQGAFFLTYFGGSRTWSAAEIINIVDEDITELNIDMQAIPTPPAPPEGQVAAGAIRGFVEELLEDENARVMDRSRLRGAGVTIGLARTQIRALDQPDVEVVAFQYTNEDGEFDFPSLPAGSYWVLVDVPGAPLSSDFDDYLIEVPETDGTFTFTWDIEVTASSEGIFFNITRPLSINEKSLSLELYPNPASQLVYLDQLTNQSGNAYYQITDMAGKLRKSGNTLKGQRTAIELHDLAEGVYLIRVADDSGKAETKKLIIRR